MHRRPDRLQTSNSFTRLEPSAGAHSFLGSPTTETLLPEQLSSSPLGDDERNALGSDAGMAESALAVAEGTPTPPGTYEELPIEIRSLTERFLESLSAKVHSTPPSADALSGLFQEFYMRASSHVATHIAALSSRLSREGRPPRAAERGSGPTKRNHSLGDQQMLTAAEIADRKHARRMLERKRAALEESIERTVCEKVYDGLWRHRSTEDEERDQKLRSRTAALSLVGIGLKELLMTAGPLPTDGCDRNGEGETDIWNWLSTARTDIQKMDGEHYPFGKLRQLTAAHKSIVEALSKIFPTSSSADEILPTMIYTIMTSPPDTLNVISNLNFIQRFRGSSRIDGETAYCLVNLEAAIAFLETVDLSSLRADEAHGPDKVASRPTTPKTEVTPMKLGLTEVPGRLNPVSVAPKDAGARPPASPTSKAQRRLSNLIQAQTNRIEAAGDAVRESILDSADQALGTINNTLESSFKFLFGRLKEQHPDSPAHMHAPTLPKTLEDARKLVSPQIGPEDDSGGTGPTNEQAEDSGEDHPAGLKIADVPAGQRSMREHSADSTQSGSSGDKREITSTPSQNPSSGSVAVESMRNFGNSLNPLNRLATINMIPRFGRASSTPTASVTTQQGSRLPPTPPVKSTSPLYKTRTSLTPEPTKETSALATIEALKQSTPPIKRFLDMKDAKEMRIRDVEDLLRDYQRLASVLGSALT